MLEAWKIAIKVYANQDDSIQYIKTLIKHVFLLNFTYELLMSFRNHLQNSLIIHE